MMIKSSKKQDVELVPDAWPRFEKFIREIVKAGPQHRDDAVKGTQKHRPEEQAKVAPAKKPSKVKGR
jgi:hypothetical protein